MQPAGAVVLEHLTDGRLVVSVDTDHRVEVGAGELVALDQEPVVHRLAPRRGVDVERIDALELQALLSRRHRLERPVRPLLPLELRHLAHHGALEERRLEHHQVVQELVDRVEPATLHADVLDLLLGALGVDAGRLHHLVLQRLLGVHQHLADVRDGHGQPAHLSLHDQLLRGLHDLVHLGGRQVWVRRRLYGPRLLGTRAHDDVSQQRLGLASLGGEQHHVNLTAALLPDTTQRVGVILPAAGPQGRQHVLLDGLLGVLGQAPVSAYVSRQGLHHRVARLLGAARGLGCDLFCLKRAEGLDVDGAAQ